MISCKAYGLTEMSGLTHVVPVGDDMRKSGSIGVLMPNLQARIIAEGGDNNLDASEGQSGELWIKGPIVMKVRFYSYPLLLAEVKSFPRHI